MPPCAIRGYQAGDPNGADSPCSACVQPAPALTIACWYDETLDEFICLACVMRHVHRLLRQHHYVALAPVDDAGLAHIGARRSEPPPCAICHRPLGAVTAAEAGIS